MRGTVGSLLGLVLVLGCSEPRVEHGSQQSQTDPSILPILPVIVTSRSYHHHVIQWLTTSQYETVELLVRETPGEPELWVFLTEHEARGGSKRQIHFVTDPGLANDLAQSAGDREIYLTPIEYEHREQAGGSRFHVAVSTAGYDLSWVFESEGDPSRQHGERLIDAAEAAHDLKGGLLAFYLGSMSLSAETSEFTLNGEAWKVEPWLELSRPPHFVAYRGVYSTPALVGYFPSVKPTLIEWMGGPTHRAQERVWSYRMSPSDENSRQVLVKLDRKSEHQWELRSDHYAQRIDERRGHYRTRQLLAGDGVGNLTLTFEPRVVDLFQVADGEYRSGWRLSMEGLRLSGKDLMSGQLVVEKKAPRVRVRLQPIAPPWARSLEVVTDMDLKDHGYTVESRVQIGQR